MARQKTQHSSDSYDFVPKGSATYSISAETPSRDYLFVLMPQLTLLALSSAIEPLRVANQLTGQRLYRWFTASPDGVAVTCSNGVTITPDIALPERVDNMHTFICAGIEPTTNTTPAVQTWIRHQSRFGRNIGGICTGAYHLANAGLLRNKRFTLHWENQIGFCELFPELQPTPNLFEHDGNLSTCGGGAAATDMMLAVIEGDHGNELATMVADMCIHGRKGGEQMPQKTSRAALIGSRNKKLLRAIDLMQANLEDPLSLEEIALSAGFSRRQMERLFRRHLTTTPTNFYAARRLERGYALLGETDLAVSDVAAACGFSTGYFAKLFKARYHVSPSDFKASWRV